MGYLDNVFLAANAELWIAAASEKKEEVSYVAFKLHATDCNIMRARGYLKLMQHFHFTY